GIGGGIRSVSRRGRSNSALYSDRRVTAVSNCKAGPAAATACCQSDEVSSSTSTTAKFHSQSDDAAEVRETVMNSARPKHEPKPNVSSADISMFERLGISADLIAQAGIERVTDQQAREKYGMRHSGDLCGIIFPYLPVNGDGRRWTARLRRDNPEIEDGKPKNKYVSAYGDRRRFC